MGITTFQVLGLLLMLSFNLEVKAGCQPNGCSVWKIVPYSSFFTDACNKHDVCYACGVDYGWSRFECDDTFKTDMYTLCDYWSSAKWWCKFWARVYYRSVREFGSGKYKLKKSMYWCSTCPQSSGDPYEYLK